MGVALAEQLRLPFYDADDHHSEENREKMRRGTSLSDEDRCTCDTCSAATCHMSMSRVFSSVTKRSIQRFVIMEKAPTRAFFWLKAATTAFTFKTLLRHYAKLVLTPLSLNVNFGNLKIDYFP